MLRIYLILISAVIIVSSSSVLIRWTGNVPATVIAFYRLFISFCLLSLYKSGWLKEGLAPYRRWHWHYFLAGLFLAGHFTAWISAIQLTTIANAILLESVHPLFGIMASVIFLKEHPQKSIYVVAVLALLGIVIIVIHDVGSQGTGLAGDILGVFSAFFLAFYILIARMHKHEQDFIKYLIIVYGSAAFFCALYISFAGISFTGYPSESWFFIVLLALGPNLLGHSTFNWASRQMQIFKVNLVLLLEPVLATLSGMIFLGEYPPVNFYAGSFLILLSLGFLFYRDRLPQIKIFQNN
jgi:drug/metabolite transporter (DMT)-like permease